MKELTASEQKLLDAKPRHLNEEQKKERLRIKNRIAKRRQRANMTEEERQTEVEGNRSRVREGVRRLLANETPEHAEERKRRDLERHLKRLENETPEERKRRLEYARKYQKNKYQKKS